MRKESYEKFKFNPKREGIIGDVSVSQAEILFILKEPNDGRYGHMKLFGYGCVGTVVS